MITTIAIGLMLSFLFFCEALREIRNNRRKANASNALQRALNHGFIESPLTEEKITELRASRWDGGQ